MISGLDRLYFSSFRDTPIFNFFFPAVVIGAFFPVLLPLIMLAFGTIRKNVGVINAAWALGQAAILGLMISWFYKVFTGRMHPPGFFIDTAIDLSHEFRLGFLRGGVFFGWPSSHTTVAFAMTVAFWTLYPNRPIVKYLMLIYAVYVGIGVSMSVHWFSDVVSGVIFGTIIGIVVGTSFRGRLNDKINL